MVNISKFGDSAIKFTFTDNYRYLHNGEIEVPLNSLILVVDESDMVTFKKIDGDPFVSFLISDSNFESKETLIYFYKTSMVGGTGGGSGSGSSITSGDVQSMIDSSISGKADSSAVTEVDNALSAHTADTNIHVTSEDKSNWNAKSDFSGSYNDLTDKPTIPTVPTSNSAFTNDEGYITDAALEPYAMTSAVTNSISAATDDMATKTWVGEQGYITGVDLSNYATNDDVTAAVSGKADSTAVTQDIAAATSGLQETLVSGTNIKTINNESILGSGNITISGGSGGSNAVEVTQAEYDALVSAGTVQSDTFYIITDATEINASGFVQTSAVTTAVTSGSTDAEIPTAKAVYDAVGQGGGGGSVTVDPTLDSGSTNPVANSAITISLNDKPNKSQAISTFQFGVDNNTNMLTFKYGNSTSLNSIYYPKINGKGVLTTNKNYAIANYDFQLVETSAITSAMTSGSTNSEVPSAKAVYDQLGGLKFVQCTQAEYDALVNGGTVDSATIYFITNVVS